MGVITALLTGSLISSLIGAGSQILGAKMNANAQLKANRQEAFNNSQQNNLINLQNQQNQINGSDYTDMYRDRISMMKCGGTRHKSLYGSNAIDTPNKYYIESKYDKIVRPEFILKGSNPSYSSYHNETPKINTNNYIDPATLNDLLSYAMRCGGSKKRK